MTSKSIGNIFIIFLVVGLWASTSSAGCLVRDVESTPGEFQSYFVCQNSISAPDYLISSYMGNVVSFSLFSFDKKGAGYLCHDYESRDGSEAKCTKAGMKGLSSAYKSKNSTIHMLDINNDSELRKAEKVFMMPSQFSTSDSLEIAQISQCFVRVSGNDIYFGYVKNKFNLLSNCLIEFEKGLSKNKTLLFDLM